MRRDDISDALEMLDEEILRHTSLVRDRFHRHDLSVGQMGGRMEKGKNWRKWYAMAAGLCLICIAAAAIAAVSWASPSDYPSRLGELSRQVAWGNPNASKDFHDSMGSCLRSEFGEKGLLGSSGLQNPIELQEPFVEISSLLACRSNSDMVKEMAQEYAKIPIGEYTGLYEKIYSVESSVLAGCIGREVENAEDWHYISGHLDAQYLILQKNQSYSLWEFHCFESEEYPYSDVLQLVYRIDSADAITKIEVRPPTMDNTDGGKQIQRQIGTHEITNRDEIAAIYQILCAMTCYGSNRWDLIDYGAEDAAVDAEGSHRAVRLGRYLTFTMDNGNGIDGLKYTAVSHMFYEFSGIAYSPLTEKQAEGIEEILGISKKGEGS